MLAGTLNFIALMQVNLSYGAWLSEQYGIDAARLGTVALLLGCFDLAASVSVSLFTDRMGKRRSVLLGGGGALVGYLVMPWLNTSLLSAVLAFAVARGFAEFFIVSNLSLLSEQAPAQRAKVVTLNLAIMQLGFTVAGFGGPWLYRRYGVAGLSTISLVALVAAMLIILAWVREQPETRIGV
jgi:predicted MFS family arabinose efflux permease